MLCKHARRPGAEVVVTLAMIESRPNAQTKPAANDAPNSSCAPRADAGPALPPGSDRCVRRRELCEHDQGVDDGSIVTTKCDREIRDRHRAREVHRLRYRRASIDQPLTAETGKGICHIGGLLPDVLEVQDLQAWPRVDGARLV